LPGKVAPSRHMVEPQSPLDAVSTVSRWRLGEYIPEVRDDLVTTVGLLLVLLRSALGDLELVCVIDTVGAVGAATDLTSVCAVAENLRLDQALESFEKAHTYARCRLSTRLVADVSAHASSGGHICCYREDELELRDIVFVQK
jgi:hypothetical protein